MPVARRDGSIIPCNLTFDEAPPDSATLEPRLAAVFHPVLTAQEMVILVGAWDSYRLASAAPGALNLPRLDSSRTQDRHIAPLPALPSRHQTFLPLPH